MNTLGSYHIGYLILFLDPHVCLFLFTLSSLSTKNYLLTVDYLHNPYYLNLLVTVDGIIINKVRFHNPSHLLFVNVSEFHKRVFYK